MTKESSNSIARLSKWKLPVLIVGFVIVIALVFYFIYEGTKKDVIIFNAGDKMETSTHAATVQEVLAEKGIHVGAHDAVSPVKNAALKDGMEIDYKEAKKLTIDDNDKKRTVWTTKDNVGEVLKEENITTSNHDAVSADAGTTVKNGMLIKIDRAVALTLVLGTKKQKTWTTADNVADFMQEKSIRLANADTVSPAKTADIKANMKIKVTHFSNKVREKLVTVGYKTIYKNDDSLLKGEEKVKIAGKEGKKRIRYRLTLKNGKLHKKAILTEKMESDKRDKIVLRGTKVKPKLANKPIKSKNVPVTNLNAKPEQASSGKTIRVSSTAYTGGGVTATGIHLQGGSKVIAVDPSVIPLGSRVWVEGYGEAIAGDTGGAIKGNKIDVYFSSSAACYSWGNRTVTIKILD